MLIPKLIKSHTEFLSWDEGSEILTAMNIQFAVFRTVTSCSGVVGYQSFGGPCCLHLQDEIISPCGMQHRRSRTQISRGSSQSARGNAVKTARSASSPFLSSSPCVIFISFDTL